jgi:catechol 2,3-dioxygenase-like lactoylglutathione lyase family enzyme
MLNVVVRDMAASTEFYRRLGIAVPGPGGAAGAHVQLKMPGGFSLELDTAESARLWHAGWRADPASATVVLGFMLPARQAVGDCYAELTSAGYRGRPPPFDAFWGARCAIVADPDGNDVGLMSPVEDPAGHGRPIRPRHPEAGQRGGGTPRDGRRGGSRSSPCPDAGRREMPRDCARNVRSRVRK